MHEVDLPFTILAFPDGPSSQHEHSDAQNIRYAMASAQILPRKAQLITTETHMHSQQPPHRARSVSFDPSLEPSDPAIPATTAYGTLDPTKFTLSSPPRPSHRPPVRPHLSGHSEHQPLLPSTQPPADTVMGKISSDLIPFPGLSALFRWFGARRSLELPLSPDVVSTSFLFECLTSFAFRKPTQVRVHSPSVDGRDLFIQGCITSTGPELQVAERICHWRSCDASASGSASWKIGARFLVRSSVQ